MGIHDLTILLVEDDQNVSLTLRNMLLELGVSNIYDATNGKEAIELLREAPDNISLVICDWNMPEANGLDVLQYVRENNPEMPFLMITARADRASVLKAKENDVSAYISKPFSFDELRKKITYLTEHWVVS